MDTKDEEFLKRLVVAFKIEAEEHVQSLSSGLLQLEKSPPADKQKSIVETIFREAHSLKSDARIVNMGNVETICQALEDVLSAWKRGEIQPSPEQFDSLHRAVDMVGQLVAAPEGSPGTFNRKQIADVTEQLAAVKAGRPPQPPPAAPETPVAAPANGAGHPSEAAKLVTPVDLLPPTNGQPEKPEPVAQMETFVEEHPAAPPPANGAPHENHPAAPEKAGASSSSAKTESSRRETVRIPTAKLDSILLQSEEMLVVKLRAIQHVVDVRDVESTLEGWRKRWRKLTPILKALRIWMRGQDTGKGKAASPIAQVLEFLDWNHNYIKTLEAKLAVLSKAMERDQRATSIMVDNLLDDTKKLLMLPFATLLQSFPKLVRDLSRDQGKDVELVIEGEDIEIDKRILEQMKDPLIHILRNCIDHGIEKPEVRARGNKPPRATVTIAVSQVDDKVEIVITDDGGGIDAEKVKAAALVRGIITSEEAQRLSEQEAIALIFQSEVSTSAIITEISGRGLGMAIVRERVEKLGGQVAVTTSLHHGTTFRLLVPVMLATLKGILVQVADQVFVLPTASVEKVAQIKIEDIQTVENRETIVYDGRAVSLARLDDVLELGAPGRKAETAKLLPVVVLGSSDKRIAFSVDEVLHEQEVLVKSLGKPLSRVRNVAGATVLGSGKAVPILNTLDLLKSAVKGGRRSDFRGVAPAAEGAGAPGEAARKSILVADDSITSRMLVKNILEAAGYQVKVAVDGMDAFTALRAQDFDLVVSDVEMPRMNGFDLTEKIRADKRLADLPVVLVTGREAREDQERGIDVGANAYIVKSSFNQSNLLEVIRRLV